MKSVISKPMMLVALAATIFSFTVAGGEGFEIFLNNKAVIRQFGNSLNEVKNLKLNSNSANDLLTVKYYHCGKSGKNRTITIRDEQNKVIKEWHFGDVTNSPVAMACKVKDILGLTRASEKEFKLYYSSSELPKGRLLTTIVVENSALAMKR